MIFQLSYIGDVLPAFYGIRALGPDLAGISTVI